MFLQKPLIVLLLCGVLTVHGRGLQNQKYEPHQSYRGQVVFLGDSITYFWVQNGAQLWNQYYEPVGGVNTGWPGDWTFDVSNKIRNGGIIDNLNAKVAVLLIGTNDLGGDGTPQSVFNNIGEIIGLIKEKNPEAKILLLGVLPRNGVEVHTKIRAVNAMLPQYADGSSVFFLDMETSFSNQLGSLLPGFSDDGVHLSQLGYQTWTEQMNPLFFSLLNGDPISTTTSGPTTTTTLAPSTTTTTRRPGDPTSAIFIGDSITDFFDSEGKPTWDQFYGPLGAINFGVSGDWTTNTISRIIVDGMLNGLSAQVAVLMIGTNDLSQDSPAAQVAENIQTIITLIKETNPGVKVLLLGILPRGDSWDGINHQRVRNVNGLIQSYASQQNVWWLNMEDAFSYDLGMVYPELYWPDWLHLSEEGYAKWGETMNPTFFQLLDDQMTWSNSSSHILY